MKKLIEIVVIILEVYSLMKCAGVFDGKYNVGFLGWYTNLSNIMVLIYFICQLFGVKCSTFVSLSVTLAITMTFLIYHFLLHPEAKKAYKEGTLGWSIYSVNNLSLHYFCPILTIIYWLVFIDKTDLRYFHGIAWLIIPALYILYTHIRVEFNIIIDAESKEVYPYPFMNVRDFGLKRVTINILVLMMFFIVLGLLFVQIGVWIR